MIARSSGMLDIRVQILVLAPFIGFSRIYRHYGLSGKRRPVDDEASLVTSGISGSAGDQYFRVAHRSRVCVRVFIGVSVRACCECLRSTVSLKKAVESKMRIVRVFSCGTDKLFFPPLLFI
jgi:hypothetical protein